MKLQPILIKDDLIKHMEEKVSEEISASINSNMSNQEYVFDYVMWLLDSFKTLKDNIASISVLENVMSENQEFLDVYNATKEHIESSNDKKLIRAYKFVLETYADFVKLDMRTTTKYSVLVYHKDTDEYESVQLTKEDFNKFTDLSTILLEDYGCLTDLGLSSEIIAKENK